VAQEEPSRQGRRVLDAVFPLAGALRAGRELRARRPEAAEAAPALREGEIAHWRSELQGSPTLGAIADQVYDEQLSRAEAASRAAQIAVATAAIVASTLGLLIALPAIGQMFDVSPWFVVAAAYAFAALLAGARAVRLSRFVWIDLEAILDPIERGRSSRGEAARDVLLVEVRARRAAAVLHNRAVADAVSAFVGATWASLRNAFVALFLWLVIDVAPAAIAAALRGARSGLG
jgi:hypothetical protein